MPLDDDDEPKICCPCYWTIAFVIGLIPTTAIAYVLNEIFGPIFAIAVGALIGWFVTLVVLLIGTCTCCRRSVCHCCKCCIYLVWLILIVGYFAFTFFSMSYCITYAFQVSEFSHGDNGDLEFSFFGNMTAENPNPIEFHVNDIQVAFEYYCVDDTCDEEWGMVEQELHISMGSSQILWEFAYTTTEAQHPGYYADCRDPATRYTPDIRIGAIVATVTAPWPVDFLSFSFSEPVKLPCIEQGYSANISQYSIVSANYSEIPVNCLSTV
jgi:hypothetical protein